MLMGTCNYEVIMNMADISSFIYIHLQRLQALQQQLIPKMEERLRRKCEELESFHQPSNETGTFIIIIAINNFQRASDIFKEDMNTTSDIHYTCVCKRKYNNLTKLKQ